MPAVGCMVDAQPGQKVLKANGARQPMGYVQSGSEPHKAQKSAVCSVRGHAAWDVVTALAQMSARPFVRHVSGASSGLALLGKEGAGTAPYPRASRTFLWPHLPARL